jgi:hypothetical protein
MKINNARWYRYYTLGRTIKPRREIALVARPMPQWRTIKSGLSNTLYRIKPKKLAIYTKCTEGGSGVERW